MKIALAQCNLTAGNLAKNGQTIKQFYQDACSAGADLVVFPEMAVTGYPPGDLLMNRGFKEELAKVINAFLAPLTRPGKPPMLIGTPFETGGCLYNAALLLQAGRIRPIRFKSFLDSHRYFPEDLYFEAGSNLEPAGISSLTAGVIIGEKILVTSDNPSAHARPVEQLLSKGAGAILNLTATRYYYGHQASREKYLAALAKKYRTGIIAINQAGATDGLIFSGTSLIYNRQGELIGRGTPFAEDLIFFDLSDLDRPAAKSMPLTIENTGWICNGLKLGIKDYLNKNGFFKAVIGLSGGVDSAVVAALAVEALGPENVLGVLMPSPYSPPDSVEDALALVGNLGIEHRQIRIDNLFHSYSSLLNPGGRLTLDLAEENLQARIRGNILMFISNREHFLVLIAGNRSELSVGYCTLYGDLAGGLAVLGDLPKLMVYELAHYLNRHREIIPRRTLLKPPSAELRPVQRDLESLPPYTILDPILQQYLDENLSAGEIEGRGYPGETVSRVLQMVKKAGYKQRQVPPRLWITSPVIERRTPGFS